MYAPSITLTSLILLLFLQSGETALLYSFKFRSPAEKPSTATGRITDTLYRNAGKFTARIRILSLLLAALGIFCTNQWLTQWLQPTGNGPADTFLRFLITLLAFGILGFLIPRQIGAFKCDFILRRCALLLYVCALIFKPLAVIVTYLPRKILEWKGVEHKDALCALLAGNRNITAEHPLLAATITRQPIQESERQIYRNALDFSSIHVKDCIVPRTEIIGVDLEAPLEELTETFTKSGKTKIIVYNEDIDHIEGYIHSSELFHQPADARWQQHISKIPIVPEAMGAQRMMQIFMKEKKSLAVVADEFGGTSGIISLEDLVEEIFGDIEDEHDTITYTARRTEDGEYLLSARLEIEKVNEMFKLNLPISDDYLTVGGLILHHYEAFPKPGQTVIIGNCEFKILKTTTTKIDLVRLKVKDFSKK